MILEIWVDEKKLDLYADSGLRHTLQANDIAEVADRQASFTNSFNIPKTSNNIRILKGLSLNSDTSRLPYEKPSCQMKLDGFDFIVNGWLNIKETSDDFKLFIYSGIINFFKAIENKTFAYLDLSEIDHLKNPQTIIDSFGNTSYKYLIADYNGKFLTSNNKINAEYLMPSVNAKYLWDKIHSTFGFDYDGSIFQDLQSKWMTYPKSKNINENIVLYGEAKFKFTNSKIFKVLPSFVFDDKKFHFFVADTKNAIQGQWTQYNALLPNPPIDFPIYGHYQVPETGFYKVEITGNISMPAYSGTSPSIKILHLLKNVQGMSPKEAIQSKPKAVKTKIFIPEPDFNIDFTTTIQLQAGDTLTLALEQNIDNHQFNADAEIKISKIQDENVSFTNEFKELEIKAFIKEIFNLYGLTPFTDEFSNKIKYRTISERINAEAKNWTDKYIEKISETYVYNDYAQQNIFRYKYTNKEDNYNDGVINIANANIKDKAIIYDSLFYSPEKELVQYTIDGNSYSLNVFKMWEKSVNKDNQIEFKSQDKKYFFLSEKKIQASITIESSLTNQTVNSSYFYQGTFEGASIQNFLDKYYPDFKTIIEDSRIHVIDLNLTPADILTLNLRQAYYFKQEAQYYLLNKLEYDYDSKKATGEFIRIKRETEYIDPSTLYTIEIMWNDGSKLPKNTKNLTEIVKKGEIVYPIDDEFIIFDWEYFNGYTWSSLNSSENPKVININEGYQKIRLKGTTLKNNNFYSNELEASKLNWICKNYLVWYEAPSGGQLVIDWQDCNGNWQKKRLFAPNHPTYGGNIIITNPTEPQEPTIDPGESNFSYTLFWAFCAIEGTVSTIGEIQDNGEC